MINLPPNGNLNSRLKVLENEYVNINNYYTVSWLQAFTDALATGKRVFIPAGEYDFAENILTLPANSQLIGIEPTWDGSKLVNGTIIKNGELDITTNGVRVFGIGITNTTMNGFTIIGNASDIKIDSCIVDVYNHGWLIEQRGGTANDIYISNSKAHGCIHGFVSKAEKVTFENCESYDCTTDGYVLASDNMLGASYKSICNNNMVINCSDYNSPIGLIAYGRDYTSENNSASIYVRYTTILGGNFVGHSAYGICLGDTGSAPAGRTYNNVLDTTIFGVNFSSNTTSDIQLQKCNRVTIEGCNLAGLITRVTAEAQNIKIGKNNTPFGPGNVVWASILTQNSTTPSVAYGDTYYETNNISSTNISNFLDGKVGKVIIVKITDTYTTIVKGTNLNITRNVQGVGSIIALKLNNSGSAWDEIFVNNTNNIFYWPYSASITPDFTYAKFISVILTNDITIQFPATMPVIKGEILTLELSSTTNSYNITWNDARIKWIGTAPANTTASKRLILQFIWTGTSLVNINSQLPTL